MDPLSRTWADVGPGLQEKIVIPTGRAKPNELACNCVRKTKTSDVSKLIGPASPFYIKSHQSIYIVSCIRISKQQSEDQIWIQI